MKRALGESWAVPVLSDTNRAFFTAGVLTLQQCRACSHVQHPPEEICEACQGFELGDYVSPGQGRIESVSVVHHPIHPGLADQVPYAIVLVSVDDVPDVLIVGNVVGIDPEDVRIGDAVRVVFEEASDPDSGETLRIPQWEIATR